MFKKTEKYEVVIDELGNRWMIDPKVNRIVDVEWVTIELPPA